MLLLTLLSAMLLPTSLAAAPSSSIAPRALAAVEDPASAALDEEGRVAVWVRFVDKGLEGPALARALDRVEAELSPRARARRSRTLRGEPRLVDAHDLPVNAAYVDAVSSTGARLRRVSRLLNAASFDVTVEQMAAIGRLEVVAEVDLVARYRRSDASGDEGDADPIESVDMPELSTKTGEELHYGANQAALDQINVPLLHEAGLSGAGVTVALFDTGFELTHQCLQGVDVIAAYDFVDDDENVGQEPDDPENSAEHGTQMLGILAGFHQGNLIGPAYGASVILARTEDIGGEARVEEDNWIAALEWAETLGVDVVSSSVGYYYWYGFEDLDGRTAPITVAADLAALRGVSVVVSAGNERGNSEWPHIIAPADGLHVIAVGGVDPSGFVTQLSSPGPTFDGRVKPDVMALAYGNLVPHFFLDDLYFRTQGVDAAVPLVAGVVALLREHSPYLTPLQVAEALRETASRALLPDNDYGWGVANALAASAYWSPGVWHEPLPDVESGVEPSVVTAHVESRLPLRADGIALRWRVLGGSWHRVEMTQAEPGTYEGTISPLPSGGTVEYTITATNELGLTTSSPLQVADEPHRFTVGPDVTPPVISHRYLGDQAASTWPPTVRAWVEDNLGVDRVDLMVAMNGGPFQGPVAMEVVGDHYEAQLPFPPGSIPPGVTVSYVLLAFDTASLPNTTTAGPYDFDVVENRGRVALVTNRFELTSKAPAGADPRGAMQIAGPLLTTSVEIAEWIADMGFEVDLLKSEYVTSSSLLGYDVVMYTTGNSLLPLSHDSTNQALIRWVENGGRLLLEGGDLAYVAANTPHHEEFMRKVLRIDGFAVDDGLELRIAAEATQHPFLHRPHRLPSSLTVNVPPGFVDYGASDVVFPAAGTRVVLHPLYGSSMGGVLLTDDDTGPDAGRIVYLPLDIGWMWETSARELLENALTYLTVRESPGPSSVYGRVSLAGGIDPSDVQIVCGRDHSVLTDASGGFRIEGLWGGTYTVTAQKPGFGSQSRVVTLLEGQEVTGLQFYLLPVISVSEGQSPDAEIPDNDPAGISSEVVIVAGGRVSAIDIDVDIRHYAVGNLRVTLTSPSGTTVTLKNLSDSLNDDLVGNWPRTLAVDGPGTLEDFLHEDPSGTWTMTVSDHTFGALGRFQSWALNVEATVEAATSSEPPQVRRTRMIDNRPNPLNPRTTIRFELAEPGPVELAVHDARGRLVRTLVRGVLPAGMQQVNWNGTDSRGSSVASGVYYARLTAEGGTYVHKMALVR